MVRHAGGAGSKASAVWWVLIGGLIVTGVLRAVRSSAPAIAVPQPQVAPSEIAEPPPSKGSFNIGRVWSEYDTGYGVVTYVNDTAHTFSRVVTIQCNAIGDQDAVLGTNQRSFFVHERGPIGPGFSGTVEIPIRLHGAKLQEMQCWIAQAQ